MIWLIFTPFLLFGLGLLALSAYRVFQHLSSQNWQPAPATLQKRWVDAEEVRRLSASERRLETARLSGAYVYEWHGRQYSSDRLSFFFARTGAFGGGANPDDWDQRLSALIGEEGGSFQVWVNPRQPDQAVVLRDIRWLELGFMVGVGLLMTWAGWTFLFGSDGPPAAPGFSWRVVMVTWLIGAYLAALIPLLWRDGHTVWALLTAIPLMLALFGTLQGIRRLIG